MIFKSPISNLLPEFSQGKWSVTRVLAEHPFEGFQIWTPKGMRRIRFDAPIELTRLNEDGKIWMSDAPLEVSTAQPFVDRAFGDVLEVGLGVGLTTTMLKQNPHVKSVTIVEKNTEVIDLVYPYVKWDKTQIWAQSIESLLKEHSSMWPRFDCIHMDIWPNMNGAIENLESARMLVEPLLWNKTDRFVYIWLEEVARIVKNNLKFGLVRRPGVYDPCLFCGKKLRNDIDGFCLDCADCLRVLI